MGQDVAVKVLRPEYYNNTLEDEFKQEVSILRYDAGDMWFIWLQ